MIKILRREIITDYPGRSNLIISFHIWEAREPEPERRHVKTEVDVGMMHFLDGGKGHAPRNICIL